MARIRSVHPGLFTDEGFVSLSPLARVLLIGIWTECDDHGIFEWKPLTLKIRLLPVDAADMPALMEEMVRSDAVKKFTQGGKAYGAVRNFCQYQRPKKPSYRYTLPGELGEYVKLKLTGDDTGTTPVPHQEATGGEKSRQMERRGEDREGEGEKKTDRGGRRAGVQVREPDPEPLDSPPADLAGIEDALDGAAEPDMGVPVDLWKPRPGVDIDPENAADVKLLNQFAKHHMETGLFSRDWPTLWRKFHDDATRPKRAPPRVETNKRPEQPPGRRVVISDDAKAVASHIEQVCNLEHHPVTVGLPLLVETWLAAWPKELIVSVVTDVMRQRAANDQGPPRTMKYFETPIARAFEEAKRPAAGAAAKPKGTTGHDRRHANSTSAVAKRLAAEFEARDADKFVDGGEVLRVADGTVQAE